MRPGPTAPTPTQHLAAHYRHVRAATLALSKPLSPEDCIVQSMPDVSPTKWHLAHTTWFFETFVLAAGEGYRAFEEAYAYLFNSYYNSIGEQFPRPRRGMLSRPTLAEVLRYREHVDQALLALIEQGLDARTTEIVQLGLQHEQQHQELIVTDIKHVLAQNPLAPAYAPPTRSPQAPLRPLRFLRYQSGLVEIGHGEHSFSFDNETPRHRVYLRDYELADRLVTNGEYRTFIEDGGYRRHELWLSEGWDWLRREGITAPLYWSKQEDGWQEFTLRGRRPLVDQEPVVHLSLYEADAFARYSGARLPREAELEIGLRSCTLTGNFVDSGALHPQQALGDATQLWGDAWEWTQSQYSPYPGYAPAAGALGEYNGKFMCNQHVLRGGSCFTPKTHIRASYRNFLPAAARWQMTGIRLARDV